jgi:hypothetical protein
MYIDDNNFHFPRSHVIEPDIRDTNRLLAKDTIPALGGLNPDPSLLEWLPTAEKRPLFPYLKPSEVFRCASDKGQFKTMCPYCRFPNYKPTNWKMVGCSYQYNGSRPALLLGGGFRECPNLDEYERMGSRPENWAPSPSRFILMHEPPAAIYGCSGHGAEWHQWHHSGIKTDFEDPAYAPQQFISPVLFVDGHAATHNFSKQLSTDPYFPYEQTRDWMWYKPIKPLQVP